MKNLFPFLLFAAAEGEAQAAASNASDAVQGAAEGEAQAAASNASDAVQGAAEGGVPHDRAEAKEASANLKAESLAVAAASPGVVSTLAVMDFLVKLVKAVEEADADGKFTLSDIMDLQPVIPTVMPMINALHNVPDELKDLDADEIAQLIAKASEALGGAENPATVLKVKASLAFAKAGYDVFVAFKK